MTIPVFISLGKTFRLLAQPARLRILFAIAGRDACVCHLEAWLGYRQAYLSQQLMLLREGGLVTTRREGKHIFYGLADLETVNLIREAARLMDLPEPDLQIPILTGPVPGCPCPECSPAAPAANPSESSLLASPTS